MKLHTWWLFVTATFFISAAPGPNMLLMMSASAAGLGVLLRSAPAVFEALRWAGALYLAYLGYKVWTAPVSESAVDQNAAPQASKAAAWDLYRVGFVTAASNPKALLFAAAFLPQFIQPGLPQLPQFGILLSSFTVIEMSWYLIYALGGFKLSTYLKKASVLKMFNRVTGGAFVGFAAVMAGMKA